MSKRMNTYEAVLRTLATHSGRLLSQAELARLAFCSQSSVKRALKRLEQQGLVWYARNNRGRGRKTTYELKPEAQVIITIYERIS
jgi:DNA-binding MarR family transcriptional regulator